MNAKKLKMAKKIVKSETNHKRLIRKINIQDSRAKNLTLPNSITINCPRKKTANQKF